MSKGITRWALPALLVPLLAACDDTTGAGGLQLDEVAGFYTVCALGFTPTGAQPVVNVRAVAFELSRPNDLPRLALDPSGTFELEYTPKGQFTDRELDGSFSISGDRVSLRFEGPAGDREDLLLPERLHLDFQTSPLELSLVSSEEYSVRRADYATLAGVPEAGLAEQIPGRLSARFAAAGCG